MTDQPLLVGIDFGTTNIKVIVFDPSGATLSAASFPTPTHYPQPDWAEYNPEAIWQTTTHALRTAIAPIERPERIVGVAVAAIGETGVLLDAAGAPIGGAIAWFDRRTRDQAQWLAQHIGGERIFAVSGMTLQPIFTLCKLLWLRDRAGDMFRRSVRWLMAADYIAYRLCGEMATDYSAASRTLMLDLQRLRWADDLIHDAGIDPALLAPLVSSGTRLGFVRKEASLATGLPVSAMVAAGGHDHVCGALALGVVRQGDILNSIGTAEAVFMPIERPLTDPAAGEQGYAQGAHTAGGYYLLGGNYTSGACVDWFRSTCADAVDYETLTREAERIPPGSLGAAFLPHLRLAAPPYSDDRARGAFVGLSTDVSRGALFRAVLEGVALESRSSLEPMLRYTGVVRPGKFTITGSATRNPLLLRIKADVLGQPIWVDNIEESTALGAAMLGGLGAGVYRDVAHAIAHIKRSEHMVAPQPDGQAYYEHHFHVVHRQLYAALRPLNHSIYELQHTRFAP
jgi:xylulokinase